MSLNSGHHAIFPYSDEDKQEILKELGLKESTIQEDIDAILDWFWKQPHLTEGGIDRDLIERLLVISKGSREKTKRRIDNFYKYRGYAPEIIQNREKYLSDSKNDLWTFYRQAAMPKLYQRRRITVIKFCDPDPNSFCLDVLFKNTLMLGDIRLRHDYILGDIWVIDFKDTSLGHFLRANPAIMQKATQIFQEGMGTSVYAIHILNAPAVWQQVLGFVKQYMKPKIMERIVAHKSVDELHMHLPKQYLPKEYGGTQPSLEDFKDKYEKDLRSEKTKQFLQECSKQISNESKRPGVNIHEEYLSGSFKKIEFD